MFLEKLHIGAREELALSRTHWTTMVFYLRSHSRFLPGKTEFSLSLLLAQEVRLWVSDKLVETVLILEVQLVCFSGSREIMWSDLHSRICP